MTLEELAGKLTLSELIKACGKYFWRLVRDEETGWYAAYPPMEFIRSHPMKIEYAKTPEAAVAHLWLNLKEQGLEK